MDITLQTTTDELAATIGRAIAVSDAGMGLHPEEHDELLQTVLDTIAQEVVRQLRPSSLERGILAALDRAQAPLLGLVVHNRATGRQSNAAEQDETRMTLAHLVDLGYVEHRGGFSSTTAGRTSHYLITDAGREALRA